MNQFYKGRTNNHLTWVMVDATDFATPESALSAAMKIKIYGKLRGATGVNFVSSGTGSLTNDIVHVGASILGIYTIALAKADLSDASAAWYDQYVVSLSATGAAYQTLIVDGGIDASAISAYQSRLSDILSAVILTQSMASDAASAATQANSRVLLVLSLASDIDSALTSRFSDIHSFLSTTGVGLNPSTISDIRSAIAAGPAATVTASDISDIASAVRAAIVSDLSDILSAAVQANSRALVLVSLVSDVDSALTSRFSDLHSFLSTTGVGLNPSMLSDIRSAIAGGPAATVTASDISDIASAVWANAIGTRVDSRVLLNQSRISDIQSFILVMSGILSDTYSQLSDFRSDLHSFVSTTGVQLNASTLSDLRSAITATQSDLRSQISSAGTTASDLASVIWNDAIALLLASRVSDIQSVLATGIAATVTASDMSDIASRVDVLLTSRLSDILSAAVQINSRVLVAQSLASDAHSAATQANSRALVLLSNVSDLDSALTSRFSDIHSFLSTTGVGLNPSTISDLRSAIAAGPAATVTASDISDIASAVWANAIGTRVDSRILVNKSTLSDILSFLVVMSGVQSDLYSQLSDFRSDLHSFVSTTGVQLNASTISDLRSAITAITATVSASDISDIASAVMAAINANGVPLDGSTISDLRSAVLSLSGMLSDAHSAAAQANSRVLAIQSMTSDAASAAQVASSRVTLMTSSVSDVYSQLSDFRSALQTLLTVTGVELASATLSDIRSAITAGAAAATLTASDMSDIASRVGVELASRLSDILSAAAQINSRVLLAQSLASDAHSAAAQANSRVLLTQSLASDAASAIAVANSRLLVNQSAVSDIYSLLSDLHSDVTVMSGVVSDIRSGVNVARINNVTVLGNGAGTPWGP